MPDAVWQERLDRFYFQHGACCAGCDWWRSISSQVGDCTKSAPVDGHTRLEMLGFTNCSMKPRAGHIVTSLDHVCGDFKDEFDWSSLPLPYRARIGDPSLRRAAAEQEAKFQRYLNVRSSYKR